MIWINWLCVYVIHLTCIIVTIHFSLIIGIKQPNEVMKSSNCKRDLSLRLKTIFRCCYHQLELLLAYTKDAFDDILKWLLWQRFDPISQWQALLYLSVLVLLYPLCKVSIQYLCLSLFKVDQVFWWAKSLLRHLVWDHSVSEEEGRLPRSKLQNTELS